MQGIGIQFSLQKAGLKAQIDAMVNAIAEPDYVERILIHIVDPNDFAAKMYADGIEKNAKQEQNHLGDLRVVRFTSVDEALKSFRAQPARLVITELTGQDFDGARLINTLRKEADAELPIFAVSRPFNGDRQKALMLGATAFLPKPLQLKTLFNTLSLSLSQVGE